MKRGIILVVITIVLFIAVAVGVYSLSGTLFNVLEENAPATVTPVIVTDTPEAVSPSPEAEESPAVSPTPTPVAAETPAPTPSPTPVPSNPGYYDAYEACLKNILDSSTYPENTIPELLGGRTLNEPSFAICDVDQDGMDELLIQVTTTYSKGGVEAIYQCENDSSTSNLVLQETYYPLVTYYDNGLLLAGWQDGNGKEPDGFWPYYIYQYNKETGTYDCIGYVYSDNIYGDCFMININDEWLYGNTDYYNQWFTDFIGSAKALDITYLPVTEDNITSFFH